MTSPEDQVRQSREVVERLKKSQIYRDYEKAFRDTTGLPINLRATEAFDLPHHHDPNENPFCALMAQSNHSCAACLQLQKKVEVEAQLEPKTLKCFAGLCHQGAKGVLVRVVMMGQVERLGRPQVDRQARRVAKRLFVVAVNLRLFQASNDSPALANLVIG